ncbi:CLUMA_CG020007, isoform A [Clunio marinus]|uniref:CLUMA_CG020007, isoform A n=1 Tax=Clunio marinus TaxID=568069 RepID=A0A1J1J3E8_9DIPT|nr:CLUMA_CG020007, isoform A [Clunio marinus]
MSYNPNQRPSGPARKAKRVSDVNAIGGTSPSVPFNPAPPAAALPPNPQQFNNMQSPGYYTPEVNPNIGFAASPNNYNQYPQQQPQQFAGPQQQPQQFAGPQQPRINPQDPTQQGSFGQQFAMLQQPMMQDMALQYGQKLADQGKEMVNKEFEKYIPVTKLKYYFAVDNRYVMNKLRLLFFPFAHKDWSLKYDQDNPSQPRYDINAPDLYIPVMAYITYVVLAGFILGTQERFSPEQLGIQASSALAYNIFELIVYTITLYVSNISTTLRTLDLLAFSGYKYAIVVAILCTSILFNQTGYYITLLYCGSSLAFFLFFIMMKKIEPSEIGKNPNLIAKAQKEMAQSDILVCGKCHNVFHFIDLFKEHKANNCRRSSEFDECRETRPKIWAYLLWKQTQFQQKIDNEEENPWKLYQTWMKLDENTRQAWLVAGETIQSFERFGNGVLKETPVKITKTLSPDKPPVRTTPVGQVVKRVVPRQNVMITEQRVIRRGDDGTVQEKIIISPKAMQHRFINRTDPTSGNIEKAAVEKIMAKRMNPRKRENEYLVKWEEKPQTWEPASHLDTCKDLIDNFEILLAKQKAMRSKTAAQQQQQSQTSQPSATSTPTQAAPTAVNRPQRFSKEKAINQVKQWTGMKRPKTDGPGQNGNVRVMQANKSDMTIGATVVRKVIGSSSPDAIVAGQKQQSGVFKKASPGAVLQKKPGEGQVRIVGSKDQIQSGIVRIATSSGGSPTKPGVVTRIVPKAPLSQARPSPTTGTVVRSSQVQSQQRILAQKIMQKSPINKTQSPPANRPSVGQVVQRQSARTPQVLRKAGTPQNVPAGRRPGQPIQQQHSRMVKKGATASNQDDDDDGIPDPFPKDLPPIETESSSPPPPLTLCPITGKVLGQAEGESNTAEEAEDTESTDQHQITQLLSNEDGTPIYITGDDGTMYQVAGKNANGETILISSNAEGEQTCVLLPADQDLLAGLPGIQTTDATEAQIEAAPLTVDAAVAEAVATGEQAEGEQIFGKEGDEASQGSAEGVTHPLSIAVSGGESGDSQDGQITAEIVQADEPSPGGTRKVVLMLPDGNLMVTELSQEQFQSLNLQQ